MEAGRVNWNDDRLDAQFKHVDHRFDEVDKRFESVDHRFDKIESRFDRLEDRFDRLQLTLIVTLGALVAATLTAAVQF